MSITKQQLIEVSIIRKYLIGHIRSNSARYYKTYEDMVKDCDLPYQNLNKNPVKRKEIGIVLAYLLKEEYDANRPLLTSVIYGKNLYRPRDGFYITLINYNIEESKYKDYRQLYKNIVWRRSIETKTVEFWRNDVNFNNYKSSLSL
jgi:hypothetical protein